MQSKSNKVEPRNLHELRVAANMANIALKAMKRDDPRRDAAKTRLRLANEALRTFIYRAHTSLSQNGKLIRH